MLSVLQNYAGDNNASSAPGGERVQASPLSEKVIQEFQNQLLSYRIQSLPYAHTPDYCAAGLSSEVTSIANALGRCIVDAPDLQCPSLSPYSPLIHSGRIGERLDDLGTVAVGAAALYATRGRIKFLCSRDRRRG